MGNRSDYIRSEAETSRMQNFLLRVGAVLAQAGQGSLSPADKDRRKKMERLLRLADEAYALAEAEHERAKAEAWIPVVEQLPEDGQRVLGWYAQEQAVVFTFRIAKWGFPFLFEFDRVQVDVLADSRDVTHWRPLPEGPEMDL